MKTHMMGTGMSLIEMVMMSAAVALPVRADRGQKKRAGYTRVARVEVDVFAAQGRVLAEELSALIPQGEEMEARAEGVDADAVAKGEWKRTVTTGETGIFCFRETEEGMFELCELTRDGEREAGGGRSVPRVNRKAGVKRGARRLSLMERIRKL